MYVAICMMLVSVAVNLAPVDKSSYHLLSVVTNNQYEFFQALTLLVSLAFFAKTTFLRFDTESGGPIRS